MWGVSYRTYHFTAAKFPDGNEYLKASTSRTCNIVYYSLAKNWKTCNDRGAPVDKMPPKPRATNATSSYVRTPSLFPFFVKTSRFFAIANVLRFYFRQKPIFEQKCRIALPYPCLHIFILFVYGRSRDRVFLFVNANPVIATLFIYHGKKRLLCDEIRRYI